jgi:CheY-like chemotaxis protein
MSARILVIEDNRANLELMTYLLRAYKYEPVSADDGESGLELARAGRPDVVICDIQLPGIDGYEVLRRLKSDGATRAIPVVAVTAFAMVGDRDRALAAGFDGYIGKPIVPETFVSQVERFIAGAPAAAAPTWGHPSVAEKTAPARHAGARVLVVDNTAANREFIAGALGALGYAVVTASNAASGLQTARTLRPDLIISDMHMPGIDGCEFLAHVRADPVLAGVPFMIASASGGTCGCEAPAGACADLYLPMPAEPAELLLHVEHLLDGKR